MNEVFFNFSIFFRFFVFFAVFLPFPAVFSRLLTSFPSSFTVFYSLVSEKIYVLSRKYRHTLFSFPPYPLTAGYHGNMR
ncbi:MAG TPA: hypothetical protein DCE65_06240 [Clostridiales bacterium]|nr:hypothetical protein [Clostridiales bacterium]